MNTEILVIIQHLYLLPLHDSIKGVLHPNQKLACFVLYLKINNTFLKTNIMDLIVLPKELKHSIEI